LSPDPVVQNHAKDYSTSIDRNAAEYLIKKWLIPEDAVGNDRLSLLADKCLMFWKEHDDFKSHTGNNSKPHIWLTAKKPNFAAHLWHSYYSSHTKVLQALACRVC